MAFRFNFFEENQGEGQEPEKRSLSIDPSILTTSLPIVQEHGQLSEPDMAKVVDSLELGSLKFDQHRLPGEMALWMINGGSLSIDDGIARNTDVLPRVYEGGLKIWECSFDAISTLLLLSKPTRILDLGCGAGLVGTWALKYWQDTHVSFHDLNRSVLERATIPNVIRNSPSFLARSSFYFGPWEMPDNLPAKMFDLVSTSDTLYDPESHHYLHNLLIRVLRPQGKAIIAAKRFYFGVGGGVSSFRALVDRLGKANTRIVASFEDGSSNIRDVLEFTLKSD
jgi:SAM-dependent methyltransferase